jgi:hypothetical protein
MRAENLKRIIIVVKAEAVSWYASDLSVMKASVSLSGAIKNREMIVINIFFT